MTTNTTQTGVEQAEPATIVDRIPTWATEVALELTGLSCSPGSSVRASR